MFHTNSKKRRTPLKEREVVIPWRGFRCFTLLLLRLDGQMLLVLQVVIPWRGFRCFTRAGARFDDAPAGSTPAL